MACAWSAIKLASAMVATASGCASPATRRCTGHRSTPTAQHSTGLRRAHLHPAKLNGWPRSPRVAGRLLGSALRGRFWILTTGWSTQPLPEPKELIDHYADSQQHQHHGDGGTHSLIILLGRIIPRGGLRTDLF
jgi:hypothetical protein